MKKKQIKPICGNCMLYNAANSTCKLAILYEGKEIHIPVDTQDSCFFENKFTAEGGEFLEDVKQVRWWVEDPETGEQQENGVVKIEYPDDFFGKPTN